MVWITMSEKEFSSVLPGPGGEPFGSDPSTVVPNRTMTLRRGLKTFSGISALTLAIVALALPSPYIVESPGPLFNTIGDIDGTPVISITGADTFDTDGELNLTTVYVTGAPTSTVTVPQMLVGWLQATVDVLPQEFVYPSGTTAEEVSDANTQAMTSSQDLALAAALNELGIDYSQNLAVVDFTDQATEVGTEDLLSLGDQVVAAGGQPVTGVGGLREIVNATQGTDVALSVIRDGETLELNVPTYQEADGEYYLGIMLQGDFEFPMELDIQLEGVGGPSAGLMFTLGIVDSLTESSLTGGHEWAGTGTVDPDGTVGAIGGIPQKVAASAQAGMEYFLAPRSNCEELQGRVPSDLEVYGVESVAQARQIVEAVRDGDDAFLEGLEQCGA